MCELYLLWLGHVYIAACGIAGVARLAWIYYAILSSYWSAGYMLLSYCEERESVLARNPVCAHIAGVGVLRLVEVVSDSVLARTPVCARIAGVGVLLSVEVVSESVLARTPVCAHIAGVGVLLSVEVVSDSVLARTPVCARIAGVGVRLNMPRAVLFYLASDLATRFGIGLGRGVIKLREKNM